MSEGEWKVGMIDANTSTTQPARFKPVQPLEVILDSLNRQPDMDILLAPEWFFIDPVSTFYSPSRYHEIKARLEVESKGSDMLIIPGSILRFNGEGDYENTAMVISNGETLLEYAKRSDGGDRAFGAEVGLDWQPGSTSGTFSWRGYDAGVEICADHWTRRLQATDRKHDLDLHLVVSCGMLLYQDRLATHKEGYALLCDGATREQDIQGPTDREKGHDTILPERSFEVDPFATLNIYHSGVPGENPRQDRSQLAVVPARSEPPPPQKVKRRLFGLWG